MINDNKKNLIYNNLNKYISIIITCNITFQQKNSIISNM